MAASSASSDIKSLSAYNYGAMALHWLIALLIIVQLGGGWLMMHARELLGSILPSFFTAHKTLGILVLVLTVLRILWRLLCKPPTAFPLKPAERILAKIAIFLFYALMLILPLSGWIIISTSMHPKPLLLFGNAHLIWPFLPIGQNAALHIGAENMHAILAYGLLALLILHICGALKHQFYDRASMLARIAPSRKLPAMRAHYGLFAVLAALIFIGSAVLIYYGNNSSAPPQAENSAATTQTGTQI